MNKETPDTRAAELRRQTIEKLRCGMIRAAYGVTPLEMSEKTPAAIVEKRSNIGVWRGGC